MHIYIYIYIYMCISFGYIYIYLLYMYAVHSLTLLCTSMQYLTRPGGRVDRAWVSCVEGSEFESWRSQAGDVQN